MISLLGFTWFVVGAIAGPIVGRAFRKWVVGD